MKPKKFHRLMRPILWREGFNPRWPTPEERDQFAAIGLRLIAVYERRQAKVRLT